MKRRRLLLFGALMLVAAVILFAWPRGPKEPVYQGKGLSKWIAESIVTNTPETHERARLAVKAAGTNALPYFLSQFTRHESAFAKKIRQVRWRLTKDPTLLYDPIHNPIYLAQQGIVLMSPDAAPALPTLAGYLCDTQGYRNVFAVLAMGGCGEAALPYLSKVIASTNPILRAPGGQALQEVAKTTEAAVPLLITLLEASLDYDKGGPQRQRTNDFDSILPRPVQLSKAVGCLYGVKTRPDLTVPALTNALFHRDPDVQVQAAYALGSLGQVATPAVPKLLQLMTNSEPWRAGVMRDAVLSIDPAALPRQER